MSKYYGSSLSVKPSIQQSSDFSIWVEIRLVYADMLGYTCQMRLATTVLQTNRSSILRAAQPRANSNTACLLYDDFIFSMKAPSTISVTKHPDMAVPQSIYGALPLNESRREIKLLQFEEYVNHMVTVSMITASLDDPDLNYCALSYCWGTPFFDYLIVCNGRNVGVTPGLFAALRRMQHMPKLEVCFSEDLDNILGGTLWVDQLCINQSDNGERSSQFQIMGDIYSGCKLCFCYLGQEEEKYTSLRLLTQRVESLMTCFETSSRWRLMMMETWTTKNLVLAFKVCQHRQRMMMMVHELY